MQEIVAPLRGFVRPVAVVLLVVWLAVPGEAASTVAFVLLLLGLAVWAVSRLTKRGRRRRTSKRALAPGRRARLSRAGKPTSAP